MIIDVREADSAEKSKLADSVHISRGLLEMMVHKTCPEANAVILTHCGGGGRASLAAHTLQTMEGRKFVLKLHPWNHGPADIASAPSFRSTYAIRGMPRSRFSRRRSAAAVSRSFPHV